MSQVRSFIEVESILKQKDSTTNPVLAITVASIQTGLSYFVEFVPSTAVVYMLGQYDDTVIAGFGLGHIFCQAFAFGFFVGISCGLEILVAQAYGAHKFVLCGHLYYRALLICLYFMIPISILLGISNYLFGIIESNSEVISIASIYCRYMIPSIWLNAIYIQTKVFLNGQNIYNYQLYTQCFSCVINISLSYLFIISLDLGIYGVIYSKTITEIINNITLFSLIKITKCSEKSLVKFQYQSLKKCLKFFMSAFPTGSIVWVEMLCFQSYAIQASYLNTDQFASNVILTNFNNIPYQFSMGISIAAATFVGNEMGKKNVKKAKQYSIISLMIVSLFLILYITSVLLSNKQLAQIFSKDTNIQQYLKETIPYVCIMIFVDGYQAVLSGLSRAICRAKYAFLTFILCYLLIGNIIVYWLLHSQGFGLDGIWIGMACGSLIYDIIQVINITWYDWNFLLKNVQNAIQNQIG